MEDFTFSDIRWVSLSLREDSDEIDPSPEPSSEDDGAIILEDAKGNSGFSSMSNLFIAVVVILVIAVVINFILRNGRFRLGRVPNAPSTHPRSIPTVPAGTNSLHPEYHRAYGLQPEYYESQLSNQPLQQVNPPRPAPYQTAHSAYHDGIPSQHDQPYPPRHNPSDAYVPFR